MWFRRLHGSKQRLCVVACVCVFVRQRERRNWREGVFAHALNRQEREVLEATCTSFIASLIN